MATKKEVIEKASTDLRKKFDLSSFKSKKGFGAENTKYKPQEWIPLDKAWQDVTSLPGLPIGHMTLLRGHSDTGKTTTLLECAARCQKMGILPVFIITELKFSWAYAKAMGVQFEEVIDEETGEVKGYDGFFLYADRGTLSTIEDVAAYIADLMDEQAKGNLPYSLCFLWDSVGSVPCRMSVESKNNNSQWNAGALSTQFGGFIDQKITLTRKSSCPYTDTLVVINKVWAAPGEGFGALPKMQNKGGNALYYDSSLVITYGGVTNSGTTKLKAICDKREYEWGKRVNIQVDKCHLGNVSSRGKIIMTPTGFISVDDVEKYKNAHKKEWAEHLGSESFDMVESEETDDGGGFYAVD